MKQTAAIVSLFICLLGNAQSYPPQAGIYGSTAIFKDSEQFVSWATGIEVVRGLLQKSNPAVSINGNNRATAGFPDDALGYPDGNTVSLGDEGSATMTFAAPIFNGTGFDFAVFENGGASFLELAFVEASSDGLHFFRFPAHSETQTATQIGPFGTPSAAYLNNLAGKYSAQYGTPFDISALPDDANLNKNSITHIRVVDVVGTIDPLYATFDRFGNPVNDSYPTPFASCGFDLQAVGIIHHQQLDLDENQQATIKIYPNPASDFLFVETKEAIAVKIFNTSGQLVLEEKQVKKDKAIDVSNLHSGVYLVQLIQNGKSSSQKLIIR